MDIPADRSAYGPHYSICSIFIGELVDEIIICGDEKISELVGRTELK